MENLREHKVERHKEKEYIESMIRDIQDDTASIRSLINKNRHSIEGIDSLRSRLKDPEIRIDEFFKLSNYITEYTGFLFQESDDNPAEKFGRIQAIGK